MSTNNAVMFDKTLASFFSAFFHMMFCCSIFSRTSETFWVVQTEILAINQYQWDKNSFQITAKEFPRLPPYEPWTVLTILHLAQTYDIMCAINPKKRHIIPSRKRVRCILLQYEWLPISHYNRKGRRTKVSLWMNCFF